MLKPRKELEKGFERLSKISSSKQKGHSRSFQSKSRVSTIARSPLFEIEPHPSRASYIEYNRSKQKSRLIESHLKELKKLWNEKNISLEIQKVYKFIFKKISKEKASGVISVEIEDLENDRSLCEKVKSLIEERESVIEDLKNLNEHLKGVPEWENLSDIRSECEDYFSVMRIASIRVIEGIEKWKDHLNFCLILNGVEKENEFEFYWNQENYLETMQMDLRWVPYSEYNKIFNTLGDPLFYDLQLNSSDQKNIVELNKRLENAHKIIQNVLLNKEEVLNEEYFTIDPQIVTYLELVDEIVLEIVEEVSFGRHHWEAEFLEEQIEMEPLSRFIYKRLFDWLSYDIYLIAEKAEEEVKEGSESSSFSLNNGTKRRSGYAARKQFRDQFNRDRSNTIHRRQIALDEEVFERPSITKKEIILNTEIKSNPSFGNSYQKSKSKSIEIFKNKKIPEKLNSRPIRTLIVKEKLVKSNSDELFEKEILSDLLEILLIENIRECLKEEKRDEGTVCLMILDDFLEEVQISYENEFIKEESQEILKISQSIETDLTNRLIENMCKHIAYYLVKELVDHEVSKLVLNKMVQYSVYTLTKSIITETIKSKFEELVQTKIANELMDLQVRRLVWEEALSIMKKTREEINLAVIPDTENPVTPDRPFSQNSHLDEVEIQAYIEEDQPQYSTEITENLPGLHPEKKYWNTLESSLVDYYDLIPASIKSFCLPVPLLLLELNKGNNPVWKWFKNKQGEITGLLIYSEKFNIDSTLFANIHHISSLNAQNFPKFLEASINNFSEFLSIRCDIFSVDIEIESSVKKLFSNFKFKWKSEKSLKNEEGFLVTFGLDRKSSSVKTVVIEVFTYAVAAKEYTHPNDQKNNSMILVGSRFTILNTIIRLYGHGNRSLLQIPLESHNRLQTDLFGLIDITNSTESFSIPRTKSFFSESVEQMSEFIKSNNIHLKLLEGRQAITRLELAFNWVGASIVEIEGYEHFFIRFSTPEIQFFVNGDSEIFFLPLDTPGLKAFFIKFPNMTYQLRHELMKFETDLFCKVEEILKGSEFFDEKIESLWVPPFNKRLNGELNWVKGLEITCLNGEKYFVNQTMEGFSLKMEMQKPPEGCVKYRKPRGKVLDDSFIFGVIDEEIYRQLDLPLLCAMVEPKDWYLNQ